MLLLRNNDIKNKGIAQIIAVAVLSLIVLIGIEGTIYNNPHVSAVDNNNISYTMEFIENTVEDMPDNILDGLTAGTSSLIPSNNPIRSGFKFGGWCDQATTKSGNNDTCASGHSYQPGGTISLNQTGANNIKLYAMWEKVTYLQNLTADKCTSTISTAIDARDGTEYHIQRLADDKCWMLDNLALDLLDSNVQAKMYSSTDNNHDTMTNASNATLKYLFAGGGTTSDKYATSEVITWPSWPSSSYSYSVPWIQMDYVDYPTTGDTYVSGVDTTSWKYGGYYNYCAASAGSYCYGNGTSYGTSSGNATEDICPKGWRMPTGNSGEYQTLYSNTNYNTYDKYREALRLPLSGYFYVGSAGNQGSNGYWWSSTRDNDDNMYDLVAGKSTIYPAYDRNRHIGISVRCVLGS